ncbi:MAG: AraC family transcriptional regulator [Oscillospiraceae bacterium]
MNFCTIGVDYHSGYVCHLYVTNNVITLKSQSAKEYYKIIHIESGTSHIAINENEYILTGAHVVYLNEQDNIIFHKLSESSITVLFFKPSVINSNFDFEICNAPCNLPLSDRQDLEFLVKFKHNVELSSKIISLNTINSLIIMQKLEQLNEKLTLQNTDFWPCRSRAYLFEILFSLVRPEESEETICPTRILSSFSKLTIDVIYYLQTNYNQKITIEKLAQVLCTNRTTILADFKKSTGLSISQYLTQLRMKIATTLLRDTKLTINEISERTGFSDISYFSKAFKKDTKYTPSEYRQADKR